MNTNSTRFNTATRWLAWVLLGSLYACCGQTSMSVPENVSAAHFPNADITLPKTVGTDAWGNPVRAKPVRDFGDGSHGLDYSLPEDTLIRAASSGVVVYAGPGLGGFLHLVIVKTSQRHLVAYGINATPLLRQGDHVNRGDSVARITHDSVGDFHFEIRERGKPVDPRSLIRDAG